jgi:hypothetical protein
MTHNLILEELYAAREKLLADAGGDAHKYLEGVRERERASGRLLSAEEQRTIKDLTSRGTSRSSSPLFKKPGVAG